MDLVSRYSDSLESLDITENLLGVFSSPPVPDRYLTATIRAGHDFLSRATQLKHLMFQRNQPNVRWVTMALQTVDSKDLQQITLRPGFSLSRHSIQETITREWKDLDRLLVQFKPSSSVHPKITYEMEMDEEDLTRDASSLLPELTTRGFVDKVAYSRPQ